MNPRCARIYIYIYMISASLVANEAIMGQQVATPPPGDWGPGLSAGSPPEGGIAWVGVVGGGARQYPPPGRWGAPANTRQGGRDPAKQGRHTQLGIAILK